MPAELIKKTDTNKQTFPKINQAIVDSFEAITKAARADQNSNLAISRMKSVQSQLNQLVIEGDSSVEAAQARVDDEGYSFNTLQERLNTEKNQVKADIQSTKDQLLNDYKNFYLDKATEVYLYDLLLGEATVNQGLHIDESTNTLYATQVSDVPGDKVGSFMVSRTTLGGKLLDTMKVRYGGHGTSFGIEVENGQTYVWTNMYLPSATGETSTQYLCRVMYEGGTEKNINHQTVQRFLEFPNPQKYMSPFIDTKNGLIALRHTDVTSGSTVSRIELMELSDLKAGNNTVLYTYHFSDELNKAVIQGMSIDGTDLYLSFGQSAQDFHLVQVDMKTSQIVGQVKRPLGLNEYGTYEDGFGEPEGLYLYTDPDSGHKTLLTILVTDSAGRRRFKLFGFSWNVGIQRFQGLAQIRTQNVKLSRDDGKAKRLPLGTQSLAEVREFGWYYMTTAEGDALIDHPLKGVGGWWLNVSPWTNYPWVFQELIAVSVTNPRRVYRVLNDSGNVSEWREVSYTVVR